MEQWKGLPSMKLLPEYLAALKSMTDCVIVTCVRDNAGAWLDQEIQSGLEALGLRENLIGAKMSGYIGIVYDGQLVFEQKKRDAPVAYDGEIAGRQFHVSSAPWQNGDHASVAIDGVEYAINSRGLNFVIYDPAQKLVLDSAAFDTHVRNFACSRMKAHYDIGVVGCWFGSNYGSLLNGYAVYQLLRSMGKSVLMIHKPNAQRGDWEVTNTHNAKFIDRFYPPDVVSPCLFTNDMKKLNAYCDAFMTGSDQVWNYYIDNLFKMLFLQNFVEDSKKKISFSTSFGKEEDITPPNKLEETAKLLKRFHAISVREKSGVNICQNNYGVKAEEVIEPVFCLSRERYDELADQSSLATEEPYMLAYILDPTPEKRAAIEYYSEISGLRAYIVPDGDPRLYERNRAALNLPDVLAGIGAEDFLRLYRDCAFVLTDSFHGTAFSVIFNKPFLSIGNYGRGYERFPDLLGRIGLMDRLTDPRRIPKERKYLEPIDYAPVNEIVQREAARTVDWLRNALDTPKEEMPSILLPDNSICVYVKPTQCTGCGACVNACPTDALSLRPDSYGYLRRAVDRVKCINCGKCVKICPALTLPLNHNLERPDCYEFVAADTRLLYASSSGGAFPVMAHETFRRGGAVAGVAWTEDFRAANIMIERLEDLPKLQKSKYFQSDPGLIHRAVKEKLEAGVFVLFTGTPCQTAGLRAYLGKDYANLIAVDILCSNAPSAEFFQKYLKEAFPNGIQSYEFRPKSETIVWRSSSSSSIRHLDGRVEARHGGKQDDYQRAYHPHIMTPKHCETCRYQRTPRFGDLSIGDFWGIRGKDPNLEWKKGVSVVLCNNRKGAEFFKSLPENEIHTRKQVPLDWLEGNGYALKDWNGAPRRGDWHNYASPKRDRFYQAIQTMPFSQALDYATKPDASYKQRLPLADTQTALQFDTHFIGFRFDPAVWEQAYIRGALTLFVKDGQSRPGHYAVMPLFQTLKRDEVYTLKMRLRTKTESDVINFHIKDSGSNVWQVIYSYHVNPKKQGEWIDIETAFRPDAKFYDEFMIGASQIKGEDSYISFSYIYVYARESARIPDRAYEPDTGLRIPQRLPGTPPI